MAKQQKTKRTQISDLAAAEQEINKREMKQIQGGKGPDEVGGGVVIKNPCYAAKCGRERGHPGSHDTTAPSAA